MLKTRYTLKQIKALIQARIDHETQSIAVYYGATNPQLIAMRDRAEGAKAAYESVLLALNGSIATLRL